MKAIALLLILGMVTQASARDDGRFDGSPLHDWFNQLASGKGLCCSYADGLMIEDVDWDLKSDKSGLHYRVHLYGQWITVPEDAVVLEPNRYGRPIVWPYQDENGAIKIRCFMPGSGV